MLLSLALLLAGAFAGDGRCRILALQGGGDKGAYQAGVLKAYIENLPAADVHWDVVTGISVGSMNGAGMSMYERGRESEAKDFLLDMWRQTSSRDVYKNWPWGGIVTGALFKPGLFDNSPLDDFLRSVLTKPMRNFLVGAARVIDGKLTVWNVANDTLDQAVPKIVASAAIPGMFPPQEVDNELYYDGGVAKGVNIFDGIQFCKDNGFDESLIDLDVALCAGASRVDLSTKELKSLGMLMRSNEISSFYNSAMGGVKKARERFPKVNFRHCAGPTGGLLRDGIPMKFSLKQINQDIEAGEKDGKAAVALPPGQSCLFLEEYATRHLHGEYKDSFGSFITMKLEEMEKHAEKQ